MSVQPALNYNCAVWKSWIWSYTCDTFLPWKGDMGGMCTQRGVGGNRRAFEQCPLCIGCELHQIGGAVPLRHHNYARWPGQEAVRGAREPGAREKWRYLKWRCFSSRGIWTSSFQKVCVVLRLDMDTMGPVSSWGSAFPATCRSETARFLSLQGSNFKLKLCCNTTKCTHWGVLFR